MTCRRSVLLGLAGTASLLWPWAGVRAAMVCGNLDTNSSRSCTAGLRMRLQKAKGEGLAWCWAASLATVFDAHGYKIGQDEIVAKAFPSGFDPSSSIDQVLSAMSLDWNLADGRELFVDAELIAGDPGLFGNPDIVWEAAQEMVDRNALISDVLGHPTLIAAMSFSSKEEGQGRISSLTVLDPWPGKASTRTLGRDEALRAKALAKIVVGEYS